MELGTRRVRIVPSLLVTCRLHGINPFAHLVDVLQRVGQHPASRVAELTPRQWKLHFAAGPLRPALHAIDAASAITPLIYRLLPRGADMRGGMGLMVGGI